MTGLCVYWHMSVLLIVYLNRTYKRKCCVALYGVLAGAPECSATLQGSPVPGKGRVPLAAAIALSSGQKFQQYRADAGPLLQAQKILIRRIKAFQRWNSFCFHNIFLFSLHRSWHSFVSYRAKFFSSFFFLRTSLILGRTI